MIPLAILQGQGGGVLEITVDQLDLDLKALWELSNPPAGSGDNVVINCSSGLNFNNSNPSDQVRSGPAFYDSVPPAIRTGAWAAGVNLFFNCPNALVRPGGANGQGPNPGYTGCTGFYAESPITVDAPGATFEGAGGGGAGSDQWFGTGPASGDTYQAGGGGGAGAPPGLGRVVTGSDNNADGADGTAMTGGAGGNFGSDPNQPTEGAIGGDGGDLGQDGGDAGDVAEPGSEDNTGGDAGYSVDGLSLVTWVTAPTLVGPTNG